MKEDRSDRVKELLGQLSADILHIVGDEFAPKQDGGSPERKRLLGLLSQTVPLTIEAEKKIKKIIASERTQAVIEELEYWADKSDDLDMSYNYEDFKERIANLQEKPRPKRVEE